MKKLILFTHTSLDGFAAGPKGEIDWIKVDEELFDYLGKFTEKADTALYGRATYEMMESYWPSAADQPGATKHDIDHSRWYNQVAKIVLSRTMQRTYKPDVKILSSNVAEEIIRRKQERGKNIVIFGSPAASHSLMQLHLIDEFWLLVNPVVLGEGIPLFSDIGEKVKLKLLTSKIFSSGVVGLHYSVNRS